jgi:hypothetical protein
LRERLLHQVLCCLGAAHHLPEEGAKPRGVLAIERLESARIAAANPFPQLVVARHVCSHKRYSFELPEKFGERKKNLAIQTSQGRI